jgi:hypothetical protein
LIAELDKSTTDKVLNDLIKTDFLKKKDDLYIYIGAMKKTKQESQLPLIFQFHSPETIDLIIKCFCAEISPTKTSLILKPQENCICNFNLFFRKKIYSKQNQELLQHFKNQPTLPWSRTFFNKTFYFYYYNDFLYVSDEYLADHNTLNYSRDKIRQFKIIYSKLSRKLNHNTFEYYTHFHIAEQIWRHGKSFGQLENELNSILFK